MRESSNTMERVDPPHRRRREISPKLMCVEMRVGGQGVFVRAHSVCKKENNRA